MSDWIDEGQRYLTSGASNKGALLRAIEACDDVRIVGYLKIVATGEVEKQLEGIDLSTQLQNAGDEEASALVLALAIIPLLASLENPLQVPQETRDMGLAITKGCLARLGVFGRLRPCRAFLSSILGTAFAKLRDFPAARAAYEEALTIWRQLADKEPHVYQNDVAMTLNNLANLLGNLRDFPAARAAYEEALTIWRQLADKEPHVYQSQIATTLNNLGALLGNLRDFPAARAAYEEALTIWRQLADKEPHVYQNDVAMTLNNLANLLGNLRDFPAARAAYEEALTIWRQLADKEPHVYQNDVAMTLNNLANLLGNLRDFPAARAAYEEALTIWRQLADKEPHVYQSQVATTLNNLANLLGNLRDFPAARAAYEEALTIWRQLADKEPHVYQNDVAMTLNNLGALLGNLRDFPAARAAYEEALNIRRQLADKEPHVYQNDVAMTLNNLGSLLDDLRDFPAARAAYEEALTIRRQLADREPHVYQNDVAMTLNNLANLLGNLRDFPAARAAYEEALTIKRQLADREPHVYQNDVATTLNNLANLLGNLRDFPAARAAYEEALRIVESGSSEDIHLAKGRIAASYRFMLHAEAANSVRAFAYAAAIRRGDTCSRKLVESDLHALQRELKAHDQNNGKETVLLIPSRALSLDKLTLGWISSSEAKFHQVTLEDPTGLIPADVKPEDQQARKHLARKLWLGLPKAVQETLLPSPGDNKSILISADPFWSLFPWELLRFGDGDEDYLGLHYPLPRIGSILAEDVKRRLSLRQLGSGNGRTSILAPFDTQPLKPLLGVVKEIHALKKQIPTLGGVIDEPAAIGTSASDVAMERALHRHPDILYYSGHGTIIQNEELLVLHSDLSSKSSLSTTSMFGKERLVSLARNSPDRLFPHSPLIVLNSCMTGMPREHGGNREDLVSTFLDLGAGAVIATALPIYDYVGEALGKALFSPNISNAPNIGAQVVSVRRSLASGLCDDINSPFWGAWGMVHLHGSAEAAVPFQKS